MYLNGGRAVFSGDVLDDSGNLILRPLLYLILAFQYTASFGLSTLVPLFLIKVGFIPSSRGKLNVSPLTKCSFFCGTVIAVIPMSIFLLVIDCNLFKQVNSLTWFAILWLPVPLALPIFIVGNIGATLNMIAYHGHFPPSMSTYKTKQFRTAICCNLLTTIGGCVIITLFLQLLCFHVCWLFPLLTAFPMKVGTLVFGYGCFVLAIVFIISGMIRCCIAYNSSGRSKASEYYNMGLLLLSTLFLAQIYYFTQASIDDGTRDGISTTMVTLFPIIVVGVFTWVINSYNTRQLEQGEASEQRILEAKYHQTATDIGGYYSKQLNELPV